MSRSGLIALVVVAVAAAGFTLVLSSDGSSNDELIKKIDALEKRIASLETMLSQKLTAIEKKIASGGGGGPSPQLESEAQAAYSKINSLVSDGKFPEAKKEMAAFMSKYGSTNTARQARRLNAELSVIGKDTPAKWGIEKWFQGESEIDLTSDKTTLLVFWEIWCPHCKREVPKMQQLYSTMKGDGLQVVGLTKLSRGKTEAEVQTFIDEKEVGYPIAKEDGTISSYFSVSGIPAAAVVKDGKIIWRGHPARLSEAMLKGWL